MKTWEQEIQDELNRLLQEDLDRLFQAQLDEWMQAELDRMHREAYGTDCPRDC